MKPRALPGRRNFLRLLGLTAAAPALSATHPAIARQLARDDMKIENEAGLKRVRPPWFMVERVLRELDEGFGNSFAILSLPENTYVQAIRGFNGFHLEWRLTGADNDDYVHYRAAHPGRSHKEVELKKHDAVGDGQHRDLLCLDDVVGGFRAFFHGESPPCWFHWRALDI